MSLCPACEGPTEWDDSATSNVCTVCGTLTDPDQVIFRSGLEYRDEQYSALYDSAPFNTVSRPAGARAFGSSKEERKQINSSKIHQDIASLTSQLATPGLRDRACWIFDQAMSTGNYLWGRQARIAAAASIAIALREAKRPDHLRQVVSTLGVPQNAVWHAFTSIVALLGLSVSAGPDPASYLPSLQNHVHEALSISNTDGILPRPLFKVFKTLSLNSVTKTAGQLSVLTAELFHELPAAPTACALFIVAAEAEAGRALPNIMDLVSFLGRTVGLPSGRKSIPARCKMVRDQINRWKTKLPWLTDPFSRVKRARGKKKPNIDSHGIKDVIEMEMHKWDSRVREMQTSLLPDDVPSNPAFIEDSLSGSTLTASDSVCSVNKNKRKCSPEPEISNKRQRLLELHDQTSLFLLDPLSAPLPSFQPTYNKVRTRGCHYANTSRPLLSFTNYILSGSSSLSSEKSLPSRLRLLAAERGGSSVSLLDDSELFDSGELEALLRDETERQQMRRIWGWEEGVGEFGWEKSCHLVEDPVVDGNTSNEQQSLCGENVLLAAVCNSVQLSDNDKEQLFTLDEYEKEHGTEADFGYGDFGDWYEQEYD